MPKSDHLHSNQQANRYKIRKANEPTTPRKEGIGRYTATQAHIAYIILIDAIQNGKGYRTKSQKEVPDEGDAYLKDEDVFEILVEVLL